ncbi:Retrovirus-related Pol polyprotein from transposon TNT 1-94 [Sesamum angolense]|uniref:Retrovirus-related Pol polyprotein from transposon TNT 1-94 n=1 Tax=Sesamum angolense TaxID=2727404 RepID=A0AAE1XAC2_9LAMI|nr:Retrovirus-related Pol polyprotein from transposon TNT 1-94 [Sesamum angolense]
MQNHTWELEDLPSGSKPLGCKWILKRKYKADGSIDKYKARLVAKGFKQKEGLDFFDTYSPVTRITSIRVLIVIDALYDLKIHQMDVKTAFLNGELDEEIYMEQLEGFVVPGQEKKVCRLVKSLYGLKQAPKQLHEKFDRTMLSNGFKINECDKCVYVKSTQHSFIIVCLYVDDMLIMGSNRDIILTTKKMLTKYFDMKDMGLADVILGIKISKTTNGLALSQSHYVEIILRKFKAYDSPPAKTPVDLNLHLVKNKSEPERQIEYSRIIAVLEGYSDANWISDSKDTKFTSGYVFTIGGGAISWKSSKQTCIARFTMESEFIALDKAGEEAEWRRNFLEDIPCWTKLVPAIMVHCDSQSAIGRAQSSMYNGKSRHIRQRHNTIRQLISSGIISIDYIKSKDDLADPLTKGLSRDQVYCLSKGNRIKTRKLNLYSGNPTLLTEDPKILVQ